jgi:DsbC/DsbD-like thiol-disulfide interchange protein
MVRKRFHAYRACMPIRSDRLRRCAAAAAITLVVAPSRVLAEDASLWTGDSRSAVRLLAGSAGAPAAPLRAAVEIRLQAGWHTYWRYPGDAGVPPQFDFSGSRNLESVAMSWPAPHRIAEQGLSVIGYTDHVILPLLVMPKDRTQPIGLRLNIAYAICEKLCVPVQATMRLALGHANSSYDAVIAEAQSRVPKKRALGEGSSLSIQSVRHNDSAPHERLEIDVLAPTAEKVDLVAEGPTSAWALPLPSAAEPSSTGLRRFNLDLDGAPPGGKYAGARITLTALTSGEAIEVEVTLD